MPTRILREGIISSERVNSLSPISELFYRRLMSVADDYGRFYAHPSILRTACYPLQLEKVSEAQIKTSLSECIKAQLVALYGAEKYLFICDFKQQTRTRSKFPEPTANDLLSKCKANPKQMSRVVEGEGVVEGVVVMGEREDVMELIKSNLLPVYKRKATDRLSAIEEGSVFEMSRRLEIKKEITEVIAYQKRNPKYFPRSLSKLVYDWQTVLDHARQPEESPTEQGLSASEMLRHAQS